MLVKTAYYQGETIKEAAEKLKKEFSDIDAKLVVYFCSSGFDAKTLAKEMQDAFPHSITYGCTTAGEIVTEKMLKNSIVAMAFPQAIVADAKVAVIEKFGDADAIENALDSFEKHFGVKAADMDPAKYVGIILTDGLSGAEEWLLDKIGNMTDILFVGGSAGDDLKFTKTHVCANGKAYSAASALLLIESGRPFGVVKTQSFKVLDKVLTATKVNEKTRTVIEFDNKPAVVAYAEALGCAPEDADKHFMTNPIGLVMDGVPFVRSPQKIADKSMVFYCNIMDGMEYHLLEATNIISDTGEALKEKEVELGGLSAILNFNCILRTLQLEAENNADAYGALFKHAPTVGFSTYGEAYLGHINQTATMVVWK